MNSGCTTFGTTGTVICVSSGGVMSRLDSADGAGGTVMSPSDGRSALNSASVDGTCGFSNVGLTAVFSGASP